MHCHPTVRFAERSRDVFVAGTAPELLEIRHIRLGSGRYLPSGDEERGGRVAVLGAKIASELFPGTNPLGEIAGLPVHEEHGLSWKPDPHCLIRRPNPYGGENCVITII